MKKFTKKDAKYIWHLFYYFLIPDSNGVAGHLHEKVTFWEFITKLKKWSHYALLIITLRVVGTCGAEKF